MFMILYTRRKEMALDAAVALELLQAVSLTTLNWLRNASVNFLKRDLSNCYTKHLDVVNKIAEEAGYKLKLGKRK